MKSVSVQQYICNVSCLIGVTSNSSSQHKKTRSFQLFAFYVDILLNNKDIYVVTNVHIVYKNKT